LNDSGARKFLEAVNCLKQKNYPEARRHLEDIYQIVEELPSLTIEQARDYEYVMTQAIYLQDAIGLEDIELHTAIATIFKKLKLKIVDHEQSKEILKTSPYLSKSMSKYKSLRLDKEFPGSPWTQSIVEEYLEWLTSSTSYFAGFSLDSSPKPGDKLKKLLKDPKR